MLAADNSSDYVRCRNNVPFIKKKQVCQVDDGPADEMVDDYDETSGRST
jgi:hypothetical protein